MDVTTTPGTGEHKVTEYFNLWNVSLWVQSGHTQVQLRAMGRKLVSTEQFAETWLLLFSDCYQRPKLADHSHVPPLCGSFHAGTKLEDSGWKVKHMGGLLFFTNNIGFDPFTQQLCTSGSVRDTEDR